MSRQFLAPILVLLLAAPPAVAAPEGGKFAARVRVDVGGDKDLKPLATSYVSRELRTLPGVTVTDERYDYEIKIIVQQDVTGSGVVLGFSMAYVIVQAVTEAWVGPALEAAGLKDARARARQSVAASLNGSGFISKFELVGGPADSLQQICQELVSEFDGSLLERDRREFQRRLDAKKPRN